MKIEEFQQLIKSPERIAEWSVDDLRDLALAHPYSQVIQLLYSLRLRFSSEHLFNQQLSRTSLLTNDRRVLFELFEEKSQSSLADHRAVEPKPQPPGALRKVNDKEEGLAGEKEPQTGESFAPETSASTMVPENSVQTEKETEGLSEAQSGAATEPSEETKTSKAAEEKKASISSKAQPTESHKAREYKGRSGEKSLSNSAPDAKLPPSKPPEFAPGTSMHDRIKAILEHNRALREAYARKKEGGNAGSEQHAETAENNDKDRSTKRAFAEKIKQESGAALAETVPAAKRKGEEQVSSLAPEPHTKAGEDHSEAEGHDDLSLSQYLDRNLNRIKERLIRLEKSGKLSAERLAALQEAQGKLSEELSLSEAEKLDQEWQAIADQAEALGDEMAEPEEEAEEANFGASEEGKEESASPAPLAEDVAEPEAPGTMATDRPKPESPEEEDFSTWLRRLKNQDIAAWRESDDCAEAQARRESSPAIEEKLALLDSFVEKLPSLKRKPLEDVTQSAESSGKIPLAQARDHQLVTETLAEVYLAQKHFKKALQAYEILRLKYPEKSSFFAARIKEIKKLAHSPLE